MSGPYERKDRTEDEHLEELPRFGISKSVSRKLLK